MDLNSDKDSFTGTSSEFQENLSALREIPFFSKLPMEKLKLFAYLCTRNSYKPGDYLFQQGDDDGRAFYILEGNAALICQKEDQEIMIREYGKNRFLGGIAILGKNRRIFSLRAMDPMICLVLKREKFKRILEQFPELTLQAIQGNLESIHAWEKHFLSHNLEDCQKCYKSLGVSVI